MTCALALHGARPARRRGAQVHSANKLSNRHTRWPLCSFCAAFRATVSRPGEGSCDKYPEGAGSFGQTSQHTLAQQAHLIIICRGLAHHVTARRK